MIEGASITNFSVIGTVLLYKNGLPSNYNYPSHLQISGDITTRQKNENEKNNVSVKSRFNMLITCLFSASNSIIKYN